MSSFRTNLCLLIAYLAIPLTSFSQTNFKEGFIIKLNTDTVKGFINYREWDKSPKKVQFKNSLKDANPLSLDPSQIKEFSVIGFEKYVSYIGNVSMDPTKYPNLPTGLDTTSTIDTIFLKPITSGQNIIFLVNQDNIKKRLYFLENGQTPVELRYHQYFFGDSKVREANFFRSQLIKLAEKYLPGDKSALTLISNLSFNESEVSRIINKLNKADKNDVKKKSGNTRFFAGLSINRASTYFSGNTIFANDESTFISPRISLGFDAFSNPNIQRLILRSEVSLMYVQARMNGVAPEYYVPDNTLQTYNLDQYTLSLTPQLIYKIYNSDKISFQVGAGVSANASRYSKNKVTLDGPNKFITPYAYPFMSTWVSIPFTTGVTINRNYEIFAKYTPYSSFSRFSDWTIHSNSISAGVNFLFNRAKKSISK
jgi:hypothetical protein